jgi:predicted transcriptional regulator
LIWLGHWCAPFVDFLDLSLQGETLDFLLAHREGEEFTQKEMAELLGISKQSLYDLEKGRRIPSPAKEVLTHQKVSDMRAVCYAQS